MGDHSFAETEIEVIGHFGRLGERGAPFVLEPIYGLKGSDGAFLPPYYEEGGRIFADQMVEKSKLPGWEVQGENAFTVFAQPLPYQKDSCLYAPPGDGPPEYISVKEAADRLRKFAVEHRERGDNIYRQACREALKEYSLAMSASQSLCDYARAMIVADDGPAGEAVGKLFWLAMAATKSPPKMTADKYIRGIRSEIFTRKD